MSNSPETVFAIGVDIQTTSRDINTLDVLEIAVCTYDNAFTKQKRIDVAVSHNLKELTLDAETAMEHTESGLLKDVDHSPYTLAGAQLFLVNWLDDHVETDYHLPYLLSRRPEFDRQVLEKHLPDVYAYFNKRSIDANTITILAKANSVDVSFPLATGRSWEDVTRTGDAIKQGYTDVVNDAKAQWGNTNAVATPPMPESGILNTTKDYKNAPVGTVVHDHNLLAPAYKVDHNTWLAASKIVDGDPVWYTPLVTYSNADMEQSSKWILRWGNITLTEKKHTLKNLEDHINAPHGTVIEDADGELICKNGVVWQYIDDDEGYLIISQFKDTTHTVKHWPTDD